jgi:hypothetical protein
MIERVHPHAADSATIQIRKLSSERIEAHQWQSLLAWPKHAHSER